MGNMMTKETSKSRMILPENRPLTLPSIYALHPSASCSGILSRHVCLPFGGFPQNLPILRQRLCISPLIVLARSKARPKAVFRRNPNSVKWYVPFTLPQNRQLTICVAPFQDAYIAVDLAMPLAVAHSWDRIGVPDPVIVANFEDSIAHCSGVYISAVLTHHNANPSSVNSAV